MHNYATDYQQYSVAAWDDDQGKIIRIYADSSLTFDEAEALANQLTQQGINAKIFPPEYTISTKKRFCTQIIRERSA